MKPCKAGKRKPNRKSCTRRIVRKHRHDTKLALRNGLEPNKFVSVLYTD